VLYGGYRARWLARLVARILPGENGAVDPQLYSPKGGVLTRARGGTFR